jgi:membrane protein
VAFYAFFSLFPALAAIVAVYGLIADPHTVEQHLASFFTFMPADVKNMLATELGRLASAPASALSWGFLGGLSLAVWGASQGADGLIDAMNIAYDEQEKRSLVKRYGLRLLLTLGGVALVLAAIFVVVAIPILLDHVGLGAMSRFAVDLLRWPLLLFAMLAALCVTYRLGPSRDVPREHWLSPGALAASLLWLVASFVFSAYVEHFGAYPRTFGSLGAVAILLMWLYFGAYVVLLGAEFDAELERQRRLR